MNLHLIADENCASYQSALELKRKLEQELKINIDVFEIKNFRKRYKNLNIGIIPAWILDGELLTVHPFDYDGIRIRALKKMAGNI